MTLYDGNRDGDGNDDAVDSGNTLTQIASRLDAPHWVPNRTVFGTLGCYIHVCPAPSVSPNNAGNIRW